MNTSTTGSDGKIILFPRQHVRRQVGKTLGHLAPAVILALGVSPLFAGTEPLTLLAVLEVLVGLTYLVLMVRELRHLRHQPFHLERIAWLELAAAAILAVESYHLWHRHHEAELAGAAPRTHVLPWVYALVAGLYIFLAFRLHALTRRRYVHLSAEGFAMRTGLFTSVQQVRWEQLSTIEPLHTSAVRLHYTNGQQEELTFESFHDAVSHRDRLLAHAQTVLNSKSEG